MSILFIINDYFLSTHSVQPLLKSGKTESSKRNKKRGKVDLNQTENCRTRYVTKVRILNGFLNVRITQYATKAMTIFFTLLIANIPELLERSHKYMSQIKKKHLVSVCILLSKCLL